MIWYTVRKGYLELIPSNIHLEKKGSRMNYKSFPFILISLLLLASSLMCKAVTGVPPQRESPWEPIPTGYQATMESMKKTPRPSRPVNESTPAPPAVAGTGSISGHLSFPSELIPPLRVVAINQKTGKSYFVDTNGNQYTYQINHLPAGTYHVIAYYQSLSGGYTEAVSCGLTVECNHHGLIDVAVSPGKDIPGVDPGDWYAPPGTFPQDPTK